MPRFIRRPQSDVQENIQKKVAEPEAVQTETAPAPVAPQPKPAPKPKAKKEVATPALPQPTPKPKKEKKARPPLTEKQREVLAKGQAKLAELRAAKKAAAAKQQ